MASSEQASAAAAGSDLRTTIRSLYHGRSRTAVRFRAALIFIDLFTIGFFIATTMLDPAPWIWAVDLVIAAILSADFAARFAIAPSKRRFLWDPINIADVIVILTLIFAWFMENWAFLRVIRALRLIHSHRVLQDLRESFPFARRNEEIITGVLNLAVFVFIITALVYVLQKDADPDIQSYIDALYFTVTTLTTTGFGDITLQGTVGRLLSIIIMVFGVGLFLRLIQAIFRPNKVRFPCPDCGLQRHDPDAVHCKHCGRVINIPDEGD